MLALVPQIVWAAIPISIFVYLWMPAISAVFRFRSSAARIATLNAIFLYSYEDWQELLNAATHGSDFDGVAERLSHTSRLMVVLHSALSVLICAVLAIALLVIAHLG